MSNITRFMLAPDFVAMILNNSFGVPDEDYTDTHMYPGLGIEFDEDNFVFTKEPVRKGYTILNSPIEFHDPINGVLRNSNSVQWEKAKENWTTGTDKIKYIGLYYRRQNPAFLQEIKYEYKLMVVLPLMPAETVLNGERMVINQNSIQIKLANR